MDGPGRTKLPFIPFSAGPGVCPGRHIVLLAGSAMLAAILKAREVRLAGGHPLTPGADLPGSLNHFALEIDVATPRAGVQPAPEEAAHEQAAPEHGVTASGTAPDVIAIPPGPGQAPPAS
jgi:hypothetical protein